jgi:hypothetical protein
MTEHSLVANNKQMMNGGKALWKGEWDILF